MTFDENFFNNILDTYLGEGLERITEIITKVIFLLILVLFGIFLLSHKVIVES